MERKEKELIIAWQGLFFAIPESDLEKIGYSKEKIEKLPEDLPKPFLLNFYWNGSSRRIEEREQRRIISLIKKGELEEYLIFKL